MNDRQFEKPKNPSKVVAVSVVHTGKWLKTQEIQYVDPLGVNREWEGVSYVKQKCDTKKADSVAVIALLKRELHHTCIVLVKQFRPPLNAYCIELPAGLSDDTDKDVYKTALRELHEETGYIGSVMSNTSLSSPLSMSTSTDPSTEDCTIAYVHVCIDGDDPKNINARQDLDDGEFIEVLLLPFNKGLLHHLHMLQQNAVDDSIVIDSRLYSLAIGLEMGIGMTENTANDSQVMIESENNGSDVDGASIFLYK